MEPKKRLFLESRYQKLERGLPQTVFFCPECNGHHRRKRGCEKCGGRGKLTDDSVQELLARRILPAFRGKYGKFHGAGREDIDVLMLGRGRPFVYEIVQPRNDDVDLEALLERFHDEEGHRVRCEPFRVVPRKRVGELKESKFDKQYRLIVEFEAPVDGVAVRELEGREFTVQQRTPQRVAHRRADLVRERRVTVIAVRAESDRRAEIDIQTEHGTYVKEWVSGDDERSTPSVAELLGVPSVCAQLDVLEIVTESLQSPPPMNRE